MDLIHTKSSGYTKVFIIYIFSTLSLNNATSVIFATQSLDSDLCLLYEHALVFHAREQRALCITTILYFEEL